jgi:hypothetical protein
VVVQQAVDAVAQVAADAVLADLGIVNPFTQPPIYAYS